MFGNSVLNKNEEQFLINSATKIGIFYVGMVCFQHISSILRIHAALPLPITAMTGLASVMTSNTISYSLSPNVILTLLPESKNWKKHQLNNGWLPDIHSPIDSNINSDSYFYSSGSSSSKNRQDMIAHNIVTAVSYLALERNFFRTSLPSSILARGVYARWGASVLASSDIATSSQKLKIQTLGRLYGCHHCGYRPFTNIGGRVKYIADHMPPNHIKHIASRSLSGKIRSSLRKILPIKTITQRLYPQCMKCMGIQAGKVRALEHTPINHYALRTWHAAPIIATIVLGLPECKGVVMEIVKEVEEGIDKVKRDFGL